MGLNMGFGVGHLPARSAASPREPLLLWAVRFSVALMVVASVGAALGTVRSHWDIKFDDAFITYRYARNVANGGGLTWNLHERPTEGYTSFLHVALLVPFSYFHVDPLLAARV